MHRPGSLFFGVSLLLVSQAVPAVPFTYDTRSLGMGGVSVATADLGAAAWANPAMLARHELGDDFSLLVGFGAFVRDDDDLIGDIDDFQDADNRRKQALDSGNVGELTRSIVDMRLILRDTENKVIAPESSLLFAAGVAFESFSMAVSLRADVIAGGVITDLSCDLTSPGCDPTELFSEDFNILNIEGVESTEYAVSFARDFELFERRVSIGIKPKVVDLNAFTFRESILTVEAGLDNLNDEDDRESLGTFTSFDIGLAMDVHENWLVGLSVRNLLTDDFDIAGQTLDFDTEARLGVAYSNHFVTVAMDFDLIPNEPLLANDSFDGLETQYLALGAEFRAGDYVALRVGAAQNVASGISDGAKDPQVTLGVGFWLGFDLDIAVLLSEHTAGAALQTGFRF